MAIGLKRSAQVDLALEKETARVVKLGQSLAQPTRPNSSVRGFPLWLQAVLVSAAALLVCWFAFADMRHQAPNTFRDFYAAAGAIEKGKDICGTSESREMKSHHD